MKHVGVRSSPKDIASQEQLGGSVPLSALSITKTGNYRYPLAITRIPPRAVELDGVLYGETGKWAESITYVENSMTTPPPVSSWVFNDLVGLSGSFNPVNMAQVTSISLPVLEVIGLSVALSGMPALATLSMPALVCLWGGAFSPQGTGSLQAINLPSLKYIGSNFAPSTMAALTTISLPALETIIYNFSPISMAALNSMSAPVLKYVGGTFSPSSMGVLPTLNLPALAYVGISFAPSTMAALTSMSCNVLTYMGGHFAPTTMAALTSMSFNMLNTIVVNFAPSSMAALTSMSFPALGYIGGTLSPTAMPALTTISLSSITNIIGGISLISGTAALTTINLGSPLMAVFGNVTITSAALTQASVDNLLARLAAMNGTGGTTAFSSPRTVTITGTSATPSAAGLASKAILVARGVTVTHN
jgi:hypothetical protein